MGKANQTFTAKEKRILLPHWVQNAYKKLQDSKYNYLRWQCFKRAGCLINADGSDDNKIKPDGIPDYVVPPPLLTFEFHAPAAEPIPEDDKEVENNLIHKMNAPEAPDKLEINKEEHRDYAHKLVHCDSFIAMFGFFMKMNAVGSNVK